MQRQIERLRIPVRLRFRFRRAEDHYVLQSESKESWKIAGLDNPADEIGRVFVRQGMPFRKAVRQTRREVFFRPEAIIKAYARIQRGRLALSCERTAANRFRCAPLAQAMNPTKME